jgi:hypothetical protein
MSGTPFYSTFSPGKTAHAFGSPSPRDAATQFQPVSLDEKPSPPDTGKLVPIISSSLSHTPPLPYSPDTRTVSPRWCLRCHPIATTAQPACPPLHEQCSIVCTAGGSSLLDTMNTCLGHLRAEHPRTTAPSMSAFCYFISTCFLFNT